MTDPKSISSRPRNKSFDENTEHYDLEINYDYPNDIKLHAKVCDDCSSYLERRHALFNQLANNLQPYGEFHRTGIDIRNSDPISSKLTITTKDLDELIFSTQMELMEEDDQGNELTTCIDIESSKHRGCYNMYCSKERTHRIDILNSTTLLADHEIPYFICDDCYAFFEYRRKAPLVFPSLGALLEQESERGKKSYKNRYRTPGEIRRSIIPTMKLVQWSKLFCEMTLKHINKLTKEWLPFHYLEPESGISGGRY
jgi:hypothetical protein